MDDLRAHEASIEPRGDRLRVIAPRGCLPGYLKEELRRSKELLLKLLTPSLLAYMEVLDSYRPVDSGDLPPVPPFKHLPERPVAWSAWWDAVEIGRSRP